MSDERKPQDQPSPSGAAPDAPERVALARRKLLKLGVYMAPAVLGTLVINEEALAQSNSTSCGPLGCDPGKPPCNPLPCGPLGCPPARD